MSLIHELGWNSHFEARFASVHSSVHVPARVVREDRGSSLVVSDTGEHLAGISGRLRHASRSRLDLPATGDFVALRLPAGEGPAVMDAVLPRRSRIARKAAGSRVEPQVLAANVDLGLVLTAAGADFNLRRLERYLALLYESEVSPAVLVTKTDLQDPAEVRRALAAAGSLAFGAPVLAVSALDGSGLDGVNALLRPGVTAVLLGSSGVGKSTLLNRLLGEGVQAVADVRAHDGRGRHTTTRRELFRLPGGALVIDTPGLRELQAWDGGATGRAAEGAPAAGGAFADVEALAAACRFRDCEHGAEAGCAVKDAIVRGLLDVERWRSFEKLRREEAYLARRKDEGAQRAEKERWKKLTAGAWEASRRKRG